MKNIQKFNDNKGDSDYILIYLRPNKPTRFNPRKSEGRYQNLSILSAKCLSQFLLAFYSQLKVMLYEAANWKPAPGNGPSRIRNQESNANPVDKIQFG